MAAPGRPIAGPIRIPVRERVERVEGGVRTRPPVRKVNVMSLSVGLDRCDEVVLDIVRRSVAEHREDGADRDGDRAHRARKCVLPVHRSKFPNAGVERRCRHDGLFDQALQQPGEAAGVFIDDSWIGEERLEGEDDLAHEVVLALP